jgi:adenylate cyclase
MLFSMTAKGRAVTETRKIAAILVADVVGYSRLTGADEDGTLSRLRGLRSDLIDPAIAAHHGRVVARTGDGTLIEFRSVVDAVRCAVEVQNGLIERNAGLPLERRIEFRVGIHLGDVVEEADGDLMGDGVNIAARLEGVCEPGAICLSEQAYWQVKGRLNLAVTDLGPTQLKNIVEPVRVYSLQVGVPAQAKPAESGVPTKRSALVPIAVGFAALLIVIAGSAWYRLAANRSATVASNAAAPRLSIVVLPFANLSGDPAQDYLADALTDELTTDLARIGDSFVIARNTAFAFKGKPVDPRAVGEELGVRYVLEGSVKPGDSEVTVNAQLIDAASGAHLWAGQFDAPRADLLQMQDQIVRSLARAMDIQLTYAETARLKRTPAPNPAAEDLALKCVEALRKDGYNTQEAHPGYRLCEQALALDPDNVLALVWLESKVRNRLQAGGSADREGDLKRADEMASKALTLDPDYFGAHLAKAKYSGCGDVSTSRSRRWDARSPWIRPAPTLLGTWA